MRSALAFAILVISIQTVHAQAVWEESAAETEWAQLQGTILNRLETLKANPDPPTLKDFSKELNRIESLSHRLKKTEEWPVGAAAKLFEASLLEDVLSEFDLAIQVYEDLVTWPDMYPEYVGTAVNRQATLLAKLERIEKLERLVEAYRKREDRIEPFLLSIEGTLRHARLRPGVKFPSISLGLTDGRTVDPSEANEKIAATVIAFFNCEIGPEAVSNRGLDQLRRLHERKAAAPGSLRVIGISLDSKSGSVAKALAVRKIQLDVAFDGKGWTTPAVVQCGIASLPSTYLLNSQGVIIAVDAFGDELDLAITRAISKDDPKSFGDG